MSRGLALSFFFLRVHLAQFRWIFLPLSTCSFVVSVCPFFFSFLFQRPVLRFRRPLRAILWGLWSAIFKPYQCGLITPPLLFSFLISCGLLVCFPFYSPPPRLSLLYCFLILDFSPPLSPTPTPLDPVFKILPIPAMLVVFFCSCEEFPCLSTPSFAFCFLWFFWCCFSESPVFS